MRLTIKTLHALVTIKIYSRFTDKHPQAHDEHYFWQTNQQVRIVIANRLPSTELLNPIDSNQSIFRRFIFPKFVRREAAVGKPRPRKQRSKTEEKPLNSGSLVKNRW